MIFDRVDQLAIAIYCVRFAGGASHKHDKDETQPRSSAIIILIETMQPVPIEIVGCDLARSDGRCSVNTVMVINGTENIFCYCALVA